MARCPTCGEEAAGAKFCPHDGTPLAHVGRGPASMPRVGDSVDEGRYELKEELGRGGMAIVFLAESRALQQDVALKVLFPRWAEDRKTVTRFAREARAASQIDHPNVVKVYDFGYAQDGFYFLAMECLDGKPLEEMLGGASRFRVGRGLNLLLEIADGVARAHELGVVHRDLKPDNIMVRRVGGRELVTIVDFGLSKIQSGDAAVTGEGDVIGTPDFMAPEQWQGRHVDARADVYSFGVLSYQILSNELPFGGDSLIQKLQQHLYSVPLPLAEHPRAKDLPDGLSDLVMRCMAKDPLDRPPHMGKVLEKLAQIDEASRAISAEPTRMGVGPGGLGSAATVIAPQNMGELDRLGLLNEIRRLQRVRQHRLGQVLPRAFGDELPEEVDALMEQVGVNEGDLEAAEEEVALSQAAFEEAQRANRAKEAELRSQLVEANLELAVSRDALPGSVTNPGTKEADTIALDAADLSDGGVAPDERERVTAAERRLAHFVRSTDEAVTETEARFDGALARSQAAEGPLAVLYKQLEQVITDELGRDDDLRELGAIDAQIALYRMRLKMLDEPS